MGRSPWWLPWAVYAVLGAVGAGVSWADHGSVFRAPDGPRFASDPLLAQAIGVALALLSAVATIRSTRVLVARTRWARALHLHLRGLLLGASRGRLFGLACASSLAEELFFRGALVPCCGVVFSAAVFGLLHVSPRPSFLGWVLWAFVMGLVFGVLYLGSGTLLAPVLAHAAINFENMQYLCTYDPTPVDTRRSSPQRAAPRQL